MSTLPENLKLCKICQKPLGEFESEHNWHYHEACRNCIYCGNQVGIEIINRLIRDEETIIYHQPCHDKKLEVDYQNTPVTITRAHLDMLTRAINMFQWNKDLSVEGNQEDAVIKSRKFISEMGIEETHVTLRRMQAITAMISISYDKHKVQVLVDERDRLRYAEVERIRADQKEHKTEKIERTREAARKLDPTEKKKEKAIQALIVACGFSREKAMETLGMGKVQ